MRSIKARIPNDLPRYVCLLVFILTGLTLYAQQPHYTRTREIDKAYTYIRRLELDSADQALHILQKRDPSNLLVPYYMDYVDALRVIILEEPTLFERLEEEKEHTLKLLAQGDEASPWYNLTIAEVHLHWAAARLKFEEYFTAASEINRAFRLLKRNEKAFPDFPYTYRTLGMIKAAFGTIPAKYQWLISLLSSLQGSVEEGLADLERGYSMTRSGNDPIAKYESSVMYLFAMNNFGNDPAETRNLEEQMSLDPVNSPLDAFLLAQIMTKAGDNTGVIRMMKNRKVSKTATPFLYLDFLFGLAKLYRGDRDADKPLLAYVHNFNGRHYIKEAYQKLAWHALLTEGEIKYRQYMRLCELKGSAVTDEDKQALTEAESGKVPNPKLLRARLYFDGGYTERAFNALSAADCEGDEDCELEYAYRLGRIEDARGNARAALLAYNNTISNGKYSDRYFACSAALHAGELMEKLGDKKAAEQYFSTCLSLHPDQYQTSLHQKAKAGLSRIK